MSNTKQYPTYSVAIRTLGKAGFLYDVLIRSLKAQTVAPENIYVYIAEGYDLPTPIADEKYIYCKKGMAAQRALDFEEIDSEYILLSDDDIYFHPDSVRKMFDGLLDNEGDCICPNVFPNHQMRLRSKILHAVFYGAFPSFFSKFAFKIRQSSYYSYNNNPKEVMQSQSSAGACVLIKKELYSKMNYKDEVWLDKFPYTSGQDQIFSYKLYRYGHKLLIHYDCGVKDLDARTGHISDVVQADFNKRMIRYIEWYRSIYEPNGAFGKLRAIIGYYSYWLWLLMLALLSLAIGRNKYKFKNSINALKEGKQYVKSEEFKKIPKWQVKR